MINVVYYLRPTYNTRANKKQQLQNVKQINIKNRPIFGVQRLRFIFRTKANFLFEMECKSLFGDDVKK